MLVVSDAGPLHYLALIGHVDKLHLLFGEVAIPESVSRELSHTNTPIPVRDFMATAPTWLSVHAVSSTAPELNTLGRGERDAILLAVELRADVLLCDDLLGRNLAHQRHLNVVGTLGILRDAAIRRLLDIGVALEQLRTDTNFRGTDELFAAVLQEVSDELDRVKDRPD